VLRHLPPRKQTMFFSATMPAPIATLAQEMLKNPVTLNLARKATPAVGITQAVYPVPQDLKTALLVTLLNRGEMNEVLVFTRTKHRANRLAEQLARQKFAVARIHGNRSQAQRTDALDGFKSGRYRVLVATDIAARGIDVEALGHVVNFDVPTMPEDYIHRVGRTARAEMTGDAFTFVSQQEEGDLRAIEQAIGKRLPRVTVPDFDYTAKVAERFEVPLAERIAEIRKRKAEERARARANEERRVAHAARQGQGGHGGQRQGASAHGAHARPTGGGHGRPAGGRPAAGRPGGGSGGGGGRPGAGGAPRGGSFGPRRPGGGPSGPRRGGNR
jgi:ATP-dependent RNA helicase RhlE